MRGKSSHGKTRSPRTKPKLTSPIEQAPVVLTGWRRKELASLLERQQDASFDASIAELESLLTRAAEAVRIARAAPTGAHLKAGMRPILEACEALYEAISLADPHTRKLVDDMHPTAQFLDRKSFVWREKHGLDAFLYSLGAFSGSLHFLYAQLSAKQFRGGHSKVAESRTKAINEAVYVSYYMRHAGNLTKTKIGENEHTSAPRRSVRAFANVCKELVEHALSES